MSVRRRSDESPRREQPLRFRWEQHVRADADVTGSLLLVLLVTATYADADGGRVRVSEQGLSTATGLSSRSVRRHLDDARSRGLLRRVRRGHRLGSGEAVVSEHELALPAQPDTGDRKTHPSTGQPRPVDDASTGHREDLNRTPVAPQPDTGDRLPRRDHSETTLSPAREESVVIVDPEERREERAEPAEETFGSRALAALGRPDLTVVELDALHRTAEQRLDIGLAAHAVYAVVRRAKTSRAGYMKSLSNDELRAIAEQERQQRDETWSRPPWCGECYEPTRRLEHPDDGADLGECPTCHPLRAEDGATAHRDPRVHRPVLTCGDAGRIGGAIRGRSANQRTSA